MAEQQPPADKPESASPKAEPAAASQTETGAKGSSAHRKGEPRQAKADKSADKAGKKPGKADKPGPDQPPQGDKDAGHPDRPHGGQAWAGWLALLIALATAGAGYYLWQQINGMRQTLAQSDQDSEVRVQALEQELGNRTASLSQRQAALDQAQQELEHAVSGMHDLASRDRQGWALAEAQFLMRVANARLRLARDVPTAITALNEADARLQALGDPALIGVREQLSREMAALKAVAVPDVEGMALKLDALAQQADTLPLAGAHVPDTAPRGSAAPGTAEGETPAWRRAVSGIWNELRTLVVIRHHDQPIAPLLSPEQAQLTRQMLRLKLEAARTALIEGDTKLYGDSLSAAQDWLTQRFDPGAAAVSAVGKALKELAATDIAPALPDISGSLRALDSYRERHGAETAAPVDPSAPAPATPADAGAKP